MKVCLPKKKANTSSCGMRRRSITPIDGCMVAKKGLYGHKHLLFQTPNLPTEKIVNIKA